MKKCPVMSLILFLAACLISGCATQSRVYQQSRDLPVYSGETGSQILTRLAVYDFPGDAFGIGTMLTDRIKRIGCSVVSPCPLNGEVRPDFVVETVRCAQDIERGGDEVSLVTVVVMRVRKPGVLADDGRSMTDMTGARTFQGVSRTSLGCRAFNDERITGSERTRGIEEALDGLMRCGAFIDALGGARK